MLTLDAPPPPFGSYAAACAQLAVKHGFQCSFWREIDPKLKRYRVNVKLGHRRGPFPRYGRSFPWSTPIEEAVEQVARLAWDYFTTTGYDPPCEGLTAQDIEWSPREWIIDLEAERAARNEAAARVRRPIPEQR